MSRRIQARNHLVGSGQMNQPERIEDLELRRAQHERLTRGKPAKAFGEVLDDKLKKRKPRDRREEEEDDGSEPGAKDPLLGLAPGQPSSIANRARGRRSGKVILKG